MNTNSKTVEMKDRKAILSTLWIFAVLNYLYADVMGGKDPEALKQLITGTVGSLQMTMLYPVVKTEIRQLFVSIPGRLILHQGSNSPVLLP